MTDWDQAFDPGAEQPVELAYAKFYFGPQGFYLWQVDGMDGSPVHSEMLTQELGEDPYKGKQSYQHQVYGWVTTSIYPSGSMSNITASISSPPDLKQHAMELAAEEIKKLHPDGTIELDGKPITPTASRRYAQRDWHAQWMKRAELEWNPEEYYNAGFEDGWKYIYTPDKQFYMWPVTNGAPHHGEKAKELGGMPLLFNPGTSTGVVDKNGQITNLVGAGNNGWGRDLNRDDEVRDRVQQWLIENGHEDLVAMKPPEQDEEGWEAFAATDQPVVNDFEPYLTGNEHSHANGFRYPSWKWIHNPQTNQFAMWHAEEPYPEVLNRADKSINILGDQPLLHHGDVASALYGSEGWYGPSGDPGDFDQGHYNAASGSGWGSPKPGDLLADQWYKQRYGQPQQQQADPGWDAFARTASMLGARLRKLIQDLPSTGGFSITQGPADGKAYFVAIEGYERPVPMAKATPAILAEVRDQARQLGGDYLVGAWFSHEDSLVYFDVSRALTDLDEALQLAEQNHQLAIWDGFNQRELRWDGAKYAMTDFPGKLKAMFTNIVSLPGFEDWQPDLADQQAEEAEQEDEEADKRGWGWLRPQPQLQFAKTAMALEPHHLEEWIKQNGPYLYHGTQSASIPRILERGLHPEPPAEDALRDTHVYMGSPDYASMYSEMGAPAALRIDLRKLDAANIDFDPDVYHGPLDKNYDHVEDGHVVKMGPSGDPYGDDSSWTPIDHHYLNEPASPEDSWASLESGAIAHRGPVPPEAIEMNPEYEAYRRGEHPGYTGYIDALRPAEWAEAKGRLPKTAAMQKWLYLNGKVMFHDHPWFAAHQLGIETGMKPTDAQQVANWIATGNHPRGLGVDVAMGTMLHGKPAIWFSTVSRNHVYDAVMDELNKTNRTAAVRVYYHAAYQEQRESIATHGLDAAGHGQSRYEPEDENWEEWEDPDWIDWYKNQYVQGGNYLYTDLNAAIHWGVDELGGASPGSKTAGDIWQVTLDDSQVQPDPEGRAGAFVAIEPIPPSALQLLGNSWQLVENRTAGASGSLPELHFTFDQGNGSKAYHEFAATGAEGEPPEEYFTGDGDVLSAFVGNQLVGSLHVSSYGEISMIEVDPQWQRRGIATAMLEYLNEVRPDWRHSDYLEDEGEKWVNSLPSHLAAEDPWAEFNDEPGQTIDPENYQPWDHSGRIPWLLGINNYIYIGKPGETHADIMPPGSRPRGMNGRLICGVIANGQVYAYDWGDPDVAAQQVPRVRDLYANGLSSDNPALVEQPLDERTGRIASSDSWWHLTDDPHFALDPNYQPQNNTTFGGDWPESGLMVSQNPEAWYNGYDYVRPFVAEIEGDPNNMGGYSGEHFIPASQFPNTRIKRVIPYSAWEGEEFDNTPYTGPDVRDMTPEQHQQLFDRQNEMIRTERPHLLSFPCTHCGSSDEAYNECDSCGKIEDPSVDRYTKRGYLRQFKGKGGDFYRTPASQR